MGLFSNNSNQSIIELYKQKAHLSNDYLQSLTPIIESFNQNEGNRIELSNQLFKMVDDLKENIAQDQFEELVQFVEIFVKNLEVSGENYSRLLKYYTEMGDKTGDLINQYGSLTK